MRAWSFTVSSLIPCLYGPVPQNGLYLLPATDSCQGVKWCGLHSQFYDSRVYRLTFHPKPGDGDREFEAARAGAAGIQEQDAVALNNRRTVGMAADDDAETGCGRIYFKFFYVVDDIDADFSNFDDRRFGKPARPTTLIVISSDSDDGSDRFQGLDHLGLPDIPGMDDQIRTLKSLKRLRPKQTVSV